MPFHSRNHHDAMGKMYPLPVPGQTAQFVTINGLVRETVNSDGGKLLLFTWCPSQTVRFSIFNTTTRKWSGPNFTRLGTETGSITDGTLPVSLRPLRMSVRIRNITPGQSVGGSVRVIQAEDWPLTALTSNANPFEISSTIKDKWMNFVNSHPMSHTYSAAELRTTHRFVLKPGQEIPFRSYHGFVQGMQANDNNNHDFTAANTNFLFARTLEPITALVMYIPDLGENATENTYEVTVHFQDAAQYEPASAMHAQSRPPPSITDAAFRGTAGGMGHTHVGTIEG
jgi:hypothetical protein